MLNELNTLQLKIILNRDKCVNNYFKNVYSIDQLPRKIQKQPAFIMVNTSPSHIKDGHWVAIFINKNKKLEFFDSFGLSPRAYKLDNFIKNNCSSFKFNNIQFQSFLTNSCGYFCLMFLLLKCKKLNINTFFSKNTIKNEKLLIKIFS